MIIEHYLEVKFDNSHPLDKAVIAVARAAWALESPSILSQTPEKINDPDSRTAKYLVTVYYGNEPDVIDGCLESTQLCCYTT